MKNSILNQFKRDNKQEYKENYEIKNPTHLVSIVSALSKFPTVLSRISEVEKVSNKQLIQEASKLDKFMNTKQMQVLYKIIWLEKNDKLKLKRILDIGIINNNNIDKEMQSLIKYREQALDYATALAVIDDYYDYLDTGIFKGPTTKF